MESSAVRLTNPQQVAWITGPTSPNQTRDRFGVNGTDIGVMWLRSDGNVLVAFGDTFGAQWTSHNAPAPNIDWRRNWIAVSSSQDLSGGLQLEPLNTNRHRAPEIIAPEPGEFTIIPTTGIEYQDKQYLHYMAVRHWGAPGRWDTALSGVALSEDGGASWKRLGASARIPNGNGDNPFQLLSYAYGPDGTLYSLGTPNGRFGDIHLARIDREPSDISSWKFWDGTAWSGNDEEARAIAGGPAGEPSLGWHQGLSRWLMLYLDEAQHAIVMRSAADITGPWTEAKPIVTAQDYPGLYGPFIHPHSLRATSRTLYFALSLWDPYNVLLMKAGIET